MSEDVGGGSEDVGVSQHTSRGLEALRGTPRGFEGTDVRPFTCPFTPSSLCQAVDGQGRSFE